METIRGEEYTQNMDHRKGRQDIAWNSRREHRAGSCRERVAIDDTIGSEGTRIDLFKGKVSGVFGKKEMPVDGESQDIMKTIDDLEKEGEETALKMAEEKATVLSEETGKKEPLVVKE